MCRAIDDPQALRAPEAADRASVRARERVRDGALVEAFLAGDARAGVELNGRLLRVIATRVRGRLDRRARHLVAQHVEDLTQQTWVTLLQNERAQLRKFDPARGSLERYVGLVAERTVANWLEHGRRKKRWPGRPLVDLTEAAELVDLAQRPDEKAGVRETFERLRAELPPKGQEILRHVLLEDLSYPETARLMGVNLQVVHNWVFRIRALARVLLLPE